jgi:hypothetical protein
MMHPNFTSYISQAHREDLQREAQRERQAAEAFACDAREAMDQPRLAARLIATARAFLRMADERVAGEAAPVEGR